MLLTIIALAAATMPASRPLTPAERKIIEAAVLPELETPGSLGIGAIPKDATMVCGRVNGGQLRAYITRDAKGRIVSAQQVSVLNRNSDGLRIVVVSNQCAKQGYDGVF